MKEIRYTTQSPGWETIAQRNARLRKEADTRRAHARMWLAGRETADDAVSRTTLNAANAAFEAVDDA